MSFLFSSADTSETTLFRSVVPLVKSRCIVLNSSFTAVSMSIESKYVARVVLILPFTASTVTKGGIHLAKATVDKERLATVVGYVVAKGPDAYGDLNKFPDGPWCEEGDYVAYGKLIGQKFVYKGVKLLLLFDDQIIMKVDNPSSLDPTFNLSN